MKKTDFYFNDEGEDQPWNKVSINHWADLSVAATLSTSSHFVKSFSIVCEEAKNKQKFEIDRWSFGIPKPSR